MRQSPLAQTTSAGSATFGKRAATVRKRCRSANTQCRRLFAGAVLRAKVQARTSCSFDHVVTSWPYLIPAAVLCVAWVIWGIGGVTILGSHMNFKTLRSDISKIQLPAGFEEVSSSESGRDCAKRPCALREFWVWRGSRTHTAIDACRDVRRAMGAQLPQVEPNDPMPHGTACSYFDILGAFLRPDLGKRSGHAFVWVNSKAKGSPGGYMVELIAAYNYLGY